MLRIPASVKPFLTIGEAQALFLEALIDDWHILSDLSFSDLLLWVPGTDALNFYAIASVRPATGPTALEDDVVGTVISNNDDHLVARAYRCHTICVSTDNELHAGIPVDVTAIPVMMGDLCWAVVEKHKNQMGVRAPGELEDHYLSTASILIDMIWRGVFPDQNYQRLTGVSPRVGEGIILLDTAAVVSYASPNAVSAYHNLGLSSDLIGEKIVPLTVSLMNRLGGPVDTSLAALFRSHHSVETDIETENASLFLRIIPLTSKNGRVGTLVVCRDTTEIRRKERQLVTKDATIREIHHRVKNNLQTVSALLRLQARRMRSTEAQAALEDAIARVQSISVVHEILSYSMSGSVDFDNVTDRLLQLTRDLAASTECVQIRRQGSFGEIPAAVATSLALVMTELCQNAIRHGLGEAAGSVTVIPVRLPQDILEVSIIDDGQGLPEGFTINDETRTSLGLMIVSTLVSDLHGEFSLMPNHNGVGAQAVVRVPL